MNDEKHSAAPDGEDDAFWEDEGGDRTITSPFDPPDLRNVPSPVSDPPAALADEPAQGSSPNPRPELPQRAHDSESTRAVSGDAFFPFAGGVAFPPPPMLGLLPDLASFQDAPDHIVVGADGVGDEATVAVAAPSPGSSNIAAALAATLGGASAAADVWSSRGAIEMGGAGAPPQMPVSRTSPAASTMAGAPPSLSGAPLSVPLVGAGVPGAPFGIRDPSSATMTAANPAGYPSSGGMSAAPYASPGHGSQPRAQASLPQPPHGMQQGWPGSMGAPSGRPQASMAPAFSTTMPYGPGAAPGQGPAHAPNLGFVAPSAAAPRSQTLLLAVVGVVCLTIFVVGVVLFLRS